MWPEKWRTVVRRGTHNPESSQDTASLIKRLAGPSTNKAGLAKDQTEINRIIAEASKGSKFYENEKRKDKDLTERIARVLKQRDEALKNTDITKLNNSVDQLLVELECQRDLSQIIVHIDMDAFFANVELLHNPELNGKAFGVGYGVLTTASYEARKYGVRSGMPGFIASKLCPGLIFVPINPPRYSEMSSKVMNILRRYDPNMCPAGADEGYLNITSYCNEHGLSADECVQAIRAAVFEETKLTVSAGIAPNKMLAKICSDKNKPNGQFHLPSERKAITGFMHDLSIRKIPGIGRVNERILESIGIKTCGDIYTHRAMLWLMDKQFGLMFLLRTYLGIASNAVQPMQRHERKSIGAERTFNSLGDKEKILQKLEEVAADLERDMQRNGWTGRTVTLKFKLDTYQVFTRAKSFDRWIVRKEDLYATGKELLLPELPLKLRLIGLRITKLKDLRAPATPPGGIKQFFESVSLNSRNKKRNLGSEFEEIDSGSALGTITDIAQGDPASEHDEYEDAMPGFHEHDEHDVDTSQAEIDDMEDKAAFQSSSKPISTTSRARPPVSTPGRVSSESTKILETAGASSSSAPAKPQPSRKPHSTGNINRPGAMPPDFFRVSQRGSTRDEDTPPQPSPAPESESNACPICGKTLETDNQGLNAHVDFCLSRKAIREAQAQAGSPIKRKGLNHDMLKWGKKEGVPGKRRKG